MTDPPRIDRVLSPSESFDRWRDYTLRHFRGDHPLVWLTRRWGYEEMLYREIERRVSRGGRILEVGTGGGPNLLWLASRGYRTTGVDYVPEVISAASALAESARLDIAYEVADAFSLEAYRGYDLAFSIGMVEHWDYDESVAAIREQAACASTVIVVVPTRFVRYTAEVTDERFYSRRDLRRMLRAAGLTQVRVYGYGDVAGWRGRLSRSLAPDIPYRWLLQRYLGWPSGSLAGVGKSTPSA